MKPLNKDGKGILCNVIHWAARSLCSSLAWNKTNKYRSNHVEDMIRIDERCGTLHMHCIKDDTISLGLWYVQAATMPFPVALSTLNRKAGLL